MPEDTFTVATWNLWDHPEQRQTRLEQAARRLNELNVDAVCLQETAIDEHGRYTVDELCRLAGWPAPIACWYDEQDERRFGCAVASRHGGHDSTSSTYRHGVTGARRNGWCAGRIRSRSGRTFTIASTHLAWGGDHEPVRLRQARELDQWARTWQHAHPGDVIVAGGDLNCEPHSDTIRYLTGTSSAGDGTYWADAGVRGDGPGRASNPRSNPWGGHTAECVGILDAHLIPPRRIDYLLVHGWAWGRPGSPLQAHVDEEPASDHWALHARLWDPAAGVTGGRGGTVD